MHEADVFALAGVLAERGAGAIEATPLSDFDGQDPGRDLRFVEDLAAAAQRPVLYNTVAVVDDDPEFHRDRMRWLADCHRRGLQVFGQGNNIRILPTFMMDQFNFYDFVPVWREATLGTYEEKLFKLGDPQRRPALVAAEEEIASPLAVAGHPANYVICSCGTDPNLQKYVGRLVGDVAAEEGRHPVDVFLDLSVAGGLKVEFQSKDTASSSNPALLAELMCSPYVVPGISDGGAHTKFICNGAYPTDLLSWLVRDEGTMTLEEAHRHLSFLPAHIVGIRDRGFLREGAAADIVVYDLDELGMVPARGYEIAFDQPAGEWRRIQRAKGYRYTLVNGEVTFDDTTCTGATPGDLIRA
jgi:N-acyl-D-aspartate/D-glutamate deacylase